MPTPEGYNHVALFSPVDSSSPRFLTTGDWEVAEGILGVDPLRGLMCGILLPQRDDQIDCLFEIPDSYFRAASPTSIERNIYSVHVPTDAHTPAVKRPTALTTTPVASYYSARFSPSAGFYLLSYEGPGVPFQKLIRVGYESGSNPTSLASDSHLSPVCAASERLLVTNAALNATVQMYESPTVVHSTIESEGYGEKDVHAPLPVF